ncbi:paraquat-inducible protein A [Opitutus sp. ER46]|uniref:paraquat-inducible protein A n=1 Tax=Opitutus sp. ER46 TaxID=2161864 RepID=UPI000D2F8903|nr:paraquat-inducible protein A [Opitutus sp. ER46]PTX97817.1 paraquat-inducible membrane protein A [Opitutus sp. ER46]
MNAPPARPARIHRRDHARAAAFTLAATIMLVPANVLPVFTTIIPGRSRTDTIMSGIVGLCEDGSWAIAAIVFAASILVPMLKIAGIATLLLAARRHPAPARRRALTRLYAVLDFIGRWSMLDVFLVAFLCGAVQFGLLAHIQPHAGSLAFAAAVVLTMLATDAFDPRSLWDDAPQPQKERP